jgi:hypothetical protein
MAERSTAESEQERQPSDETEALLAWVRGLLGQGHAREAGEMLRRMRLEADAARDDPARTAIRIAALELKARLIGSPALAELNTGLLVGSEPPGERAAAVDVAGELASTFAAAARTLANPAACGVASMLVASGAAVYTWARVIFALSVFCQGPPARGANIGRAAAVTFLGGLLGAAALVLVRRRRVLLAVTLVVCAAVLGSAIALVALDSATYAQIDTASTCPIMGLLDVPASIHTEHVDGLYELWGVPLIVLLVAAAWAWTRPRWKR